MKYKFKGRFSKQILFMSYLLMTFMIAYACFLNNVIDPSSNGMDYIKKINFKYFKPEAPSNNFVIDSIHDLVTHLDLLEPNNNEIKFNYMLEDLKKSYFQNQNQDSDRILKQLKDFYSIQYLDKKSLMYSLKNIEYLKGNLEECKTDLTKVHFNFQLKEILNSDKNER